MLIMKKKNQHPTPREYRVKYKINGSLEQNIQYYNVFHSSEALDFLAHTFRRENIEGDKLTIIAIEEYDRFRNAWDGRLEKAVQFAESPEILAKNDEVFLIRDKQ